MLAEHVLATDARNEEAGVESRTFGCPESTAPLLMPAAHSRTAQCNASLYYWRFLRLLATT
jgi:hypothetical protein